MTNLRELYKCSICGNVVEIVHTGATSLVCCGQPMEKMAVKTQDEGREKHLPVVEKTDGGILVKVGSVEHPMLDAHYIQFIEVLTKEKVCRAELAPGMKPEAQFPVAMEDVLQVREYCNLHGVWATEL